MANSGFTGAANQIEGTYGFFSGYSEDPRPEAFESLGTEHSILDTALKPFPCCRYMHSAIDGLIDLSSTIDPHAVESITVELPKAGVRLTGDPIEAKRRPDSLVDAQFSMPFAAAVAVVHGDAGLKTFLEAVERSDRQDYRDLIDVTHLSVSERVQSVFPEQWAAHVSVTAGGKTRERFVETAPGEPERPLDWATVREKFVELTDAAGWTESTQRDVVQTIRAVDEHTVPELIARITDR
jgi:2-methylcitrate dehydratase PrpD